MYMCTVESCRGWLRVTAIHPRELGCESSSRALENRNITQLQRRGKVGNRTAGEKICAKGLQDRGRNQD